MEIININYLHYIPFIVALYLFTTKYCWPKFFKKTPPSPTICLPVIGHLYVLKEPINQTFANLANRYGPILHLWFGSRPILMVSSPSAAEECLSKNDVIFCNRPRNFLAGKYLGYDYTSLTWAPYGGHWRNMRRISAIEILSSHRLQTLASIRSDEVKLLIQRLYKVVGSSIKMKPLLFDLTLNIMTRMLFGKRYYGVEDEEAERFREIVTGTFRLFNEICIGDMVPYLRWLDWRKEKKFKEFNKYRQQVMKDLVEEHRTEMNKLKEVGGEESKARRPLIQVLLGLQESEPEYYNDDIILGILLELLIGGSDTTTGIMEWALSLLLNHKEVIKKAQTEIDNNIGCDRMLQESDLSHLPYLRCIINETLRMYPAVPNLIPHESSEDCIVGGYQIPRGTMLQVNLWGIQNDPKLWDDPASFKPERFEGVEGHKIGYKMMPFGSGRRSCPGEGLAIRVVGLTIGCLIQCFEWDKIDDKLVDMSKAPGFNMQKAEPLWATPQLRPTMTKLLAQL